MEVRSGSALLAAALGYARRGWRVIPLHTPTGDPDCPCTCGRRAEHVSGICTSPGKHPRLHGWPDRATVEEGQVRKWWSMWPEANVGVATGKDSGLWALDIDGEAGLESLRKLEEANSPLPLTPEQLTGGGGYHRLFQYAPSVGNKVGFAPYLDTRSDGGVIVAEPSLHESGREYAWNLDAHPDDVGIAAAPGWLLTAIRRGAGAGSGGPAASPPVGKTVALGARNATLASMAGTMRRRGAEAEEIEPALQRMNKRRCSPPLPESEVHDIAASIGRYPPEPAATNGATRATTAFVASGAFVADSPKYEPPRELAPEALYGVAGEVVRIFEPHTESAPVALLVSFLVMIGNVFGRGPHFWIEGARHGTNLFATLVGPTAAARKGTATRRIDELIRSIDCNWTKNIVRGLSSGEGLVHHVRDPRIDQVPVKKSGRFTGEYDEVTVDKGVEDKRAMVREEEFASVLKVAAREGNTLSVRIREAWDNVSMGSLTKGSKETATDPHISILGHITDVELRRYLTETEAGNGFANRFLWVCTHRSKFLPRGGGKPNLAPLSYQLHEIGEIAQRLDVFDFDDQAGALWDAIYPALSAGKPGLLGAVTSRAESQVLRLSVLYATLDGLPLIQTSHLLAALALWDFCEASCRYIFGVATGDDVADTIEEALREVYPGSLTRTEIRDKFGRHMAAGRIPRSLATLAREERAERVEVQTGGRPAEHWRAILRTPGDKSDISDKSHLERAKRALQGSG